MTARTLKVFTLGIVFFSVGAALGSATGPADKTLEEIAHYRQWTRVTPQPLIVQLELQSLGG